MLHLSIVLHFTKKKVNLFEVKDFFLLSFFLLLVSTEPCLNFQCNHGTCQKDRNNQPYCSCYEGYGGSRCETQIGV